MSEASKKARALLGEATRGPWTHHTDDGHGVKVERVTYIATDRWNKGATHFVVSVVEGSGMDHKDKHNARLIAAAPSLIAELCEEVERAQADADAAHQQSLDYCEELSRQHDADCDVLTARKERDSALAEVATLKARVVEVERERDAYRAMVCDLLASAHPHPTEHPTMTRQWARARELLKNGPTKEPSK